MWLRTREGKQPQQMPRATRNSDVASSTEEGEPSETQESDGRNDKRDTAVLKRPLKRCPGKEFRKRLLQLAALGDSDRDARPVAPIDRHVLDFSHDLHRVFPEDLSKDHVLFIQPVALCTSDEELTSVRVWPAVRQRQETAAEVGKNKRLVRKGSSVD